MARSTQIFQKRHFEFIASHLRDSGASPRVVTQWANALHSTNSLFQRDRFIEAATPLEDIDDEQDAKTERTARRMAEVVS